MISRPQNLGASVEFSNVQLGDVRLNRRAIKIVERLDAMPAAPFPKALVSVADLEGFYRFLSNPKVTPDALLEPHIRATVERLSGLDEALAVHDTTENSYGGKRHGLGPLKKKSEGYLAHVTLAVPLQLDAPPLGVLGLQAWARTGDSKTMRLKKGEITYRQGRELPNEHDRWFAAILAAEATVDARTSLIHVADSEGDDYELLADLFETGCRCVIRLCRDRILAGADSSEPAKLKAALAKQPVMAKRKVLLSPRAKSLFPERKRNLARAERVATLSVRSGVVALRKPDYVKNASSQITANVIAVTEDNPPAGEEPTEWMLITTEPIGTPEQILRVVDIYRARWRIEEFFKALKTGCALEERQLESAQTLVNALAVFIPIAWNLLRLRSVVRSDPQSPIDAVLTPEEVTVLGLAAETRLPAKPTAGDALMAIARLGGHLRSNGDPGWQVLGRGYQALLMLVAGYRLRDQKDVIYR